MAVLAFVAVALIGAPSAQAAGGYPDGATGNDVSWPQCPGALPSAGVGVAIVGVDNGHPFDFITGRFNPNACLSREWAWARTSPYQPSVYLNVDYPSHVNAGADPHWYGYQSAQAAVSYARAQGVNPAVWWLDVETSNYWPPGPTASNAQVVQGNLDYLHSQQLTAGVYSTPYQWGLLTGFYTPPGGVPVWSADYNDPANQAYLGCTSAHAFAGGDVWMVQSPPVTWDRDYSCPSHHGYWLVAGDGGIFPFGVAGGYGSTGRIRLNRPVVGMASTPDGHGYWLVASDGGVFPFGDAVGYGSTGNIRLNQPVVGMAATPDGHGYWLVASDGGIFPFGDAAGYGSTGNIRLNRPVVGMAAMPDGHGYWLVASDGGIFPFGAAGGYGSTGNVRLNKPVVGMARTAAGNGYWLVASDGGIFSFGAAPGFGSAGSMRLSSPVVGMAVTADGGGYWMATAQGGVIPFGDAVPQAYGTLVNVPLAKPVLGIAAAA